MYRALTLEIMRSFLGKVKKEVQHCETRNLKNKRKPLLWGYNNAFQRI